MANDNGEPIGEIDIKIGGDYSDLQDQINKAAQAAATGAEQISKAFEMPVSDDALVSAMQNIAHSVEDATGQMSLFGDTAKAAIQQVAEQMSLFDTSSIDAAGSGFGAISVAASDAIPPIKDLGAAASSTKVEVVGLGESLASVGSILLGGIGILEAVNSIKALASESIDAFGRLQMIQEGLTALTGSAEAASQALSAIRDVASSSIFSFPDLAQAAQKMAAIGVSAEELPAALRAVADAAEVTGNSLTAVASGLDRVFLSGTLNTRTLAQMGISMQDLADSMGISTNQVAQAFKGMGEQSADALDILTSTIDSKMGEAAAAIQDTLPVAINQLKVEWDSLLQDFGKDIAPSLEKVLTVLEEILPYAEKFAAALINADVAEFSPLVQSFENLKSALAGIIPSLGDMKGALQTIQGIFSDASAIEKWITPWGQLSIAINTVAGALQKLSGALPADLLAGPLKTLTDFNTQYTQSLVAEQLAQDANTNAAQRHAAALQGLANVAKDTGKDYDQLGTEMTSAFEQADKLLTKMPADFADFEAGVQQGFNFKSLDNQFTDFIQNMTRTGLAATDFGSTLVAAVQTAKDKLDVFLADDSLEKNSEKELAALDALTARIDKLNETDLTPINKQFEAFDQAVSKALSASMFDPYYAALDKLGIDTDGETKKMEADFAEFNTIVVNSKSGLDTIEGAWAKIQTDITKLAKDPDGLSAIVNLQNEYLAALERANAPLSQILAAQVSMYSTQLKYLEAWGGTSDQILAVGIQLQNAKIQQSALTDAAQGTLNLYVNIEKEFASAFTEFGNGIASAIVGTQSWGAAMQKVLQDMELKLTELVVNYMLHQLWDAIVLNTKAFSDLGKTASDTFGSIGTTTSQTASGLQSSATQIQSAGTGLLGSLSQTVTMISGIATAIEGLVQVFEQAHTNTLLDRVELNTRQTATYLGAGGGVIDYLSKILPAVSDLNAGFQGWYHDAFASLMTTVEDIDAKMAMGGGGGGGGGGDVGGSTLVTGSPGPFPTSGGGSTVDTGTGVVTTTDSNGNVTTTAPSSSFAPTKTAPGTPVTSPPITTVNMPTSPDPSTGVVGTPIYAWDGNSWVQTAYNFAGMANLGTPEGTGLPASGQYQIQEAQILEAAGATNVNFPIGGQGVNYSATGNTASAVQNALQAFLTEGAYTGNVGFSATPYSAPPGTVNAGTAGPLDEWQQQLEDAVRAAGGFVDAIGDGTVQFSNVAAAALGSLNDTIAQINAAHAGVPSIGVVTGHKTTDYDPSTGQSYGADSAIHPNALTPAQIQAQWANFNPFSPDSGASANDDRNLLQQLVDVQKANAALGANSPITTAQATALNTEISQLTAALKVTYTPQTQTNSAAQLAALLGQSSTVPGSFGNGQPVINITINNPQVPSTAAANQLGTTLVNTLRQANNQLRYI